MLIGRVKVRKKERPETTVHTTGEKEGKTRMNIEANGTLLKYIKLDYQCF
jgi:hypothetical protein